MSNSAGILVSGASSITQEQSDLPRSSTRSPKKDHTWCVLYTGFADAAWNMALDEWLFATAGSRPPVLRLYGWQYPTISLGRHEPWRRKVDLERVKTHGVRLVRRITGGRSVFHHRELTYSVTAPRGVYDAFDEGLEATLKTISVALVKGLEQLGVEASFRRRRQTGGSASGFCFESASRYELVSEGRKVVGSAQYRSTDAFLQHGSIPAYGTLTDLWALSPRNRVRPVDEPGQNQPSPWHHQTLDRLASALVGGFQRELGWNVRRMTPGTVDGEAVAALCRNRYGSPKWTFRR
jgi:lipoate-protein ligase A